MNINNLNIPQWVLQKAKPFKFDNFEITRISSVHKNSYTIIRDHNEVFAELSGNLLFNLESSLDFPTVGDWVLTQPFNQNQSAIIHAIIPRKTLLKRKIAGRKTEYQLIAANVDISLIIQSLDQDFNLRRLERYIAISKESNIQPIILLSKSDLLFQKETDSKISEIVSIMPDLIIIPFSNFLRSNLEQISGLLSCGMTYCLLGSSGVGKTTLLNHILEKNLFKTGEVRKDGKGKHTTTNRQLIRLINGSTIIDTPGMKELGITDSQKGISQTFQEISELALQCRFSNCTHASEKGCAVLEALNSGLLSQERYDNYLKMQKESEFYEMSYAEKRQKERKIGKLYKNILKNHNQQKHSS